MSATAAASRTFDIAGCRATVTVPTLARGEVGTAVIEWEPAPPDFARFSASERVAYQQRLVAAIMALTVGAA